MSGTKPAIVIHILSTAVRPVLLYGLQYVNQNKYVMRDVEMLQAKLLKSASDLKRYCRKAPLL